MGIRGKFVYSAGNKTEQPKILYDKLSCELPGGISFSAHARDQLGILPELLSWWRNRKRNRSFAKAKARAAHNLLLCAIFGHQPELMVDERIPTILWSSCRRCRSLFGSVSHRGWAATPQEPERVFVPNSNK